jgi:glycerophosphoryl diester phosphodiesterase
MAVLAVFVAVAACGKPADPTKTAATDAGGFSPPAIAASRDPGPASPVATAASRTAPLAERFDCLREQHAMVIAAHRGGPTREYPANAIETFNRTLKAATPIMEVDVNRSSEGVLFLMHDDELDQQTNLSGPVAATPWSKIQTANLRTNSAETSYHPPSLDAALDWAVQHNAVLELDTKRGTPLEAVIKAIESRRAQDNVVLITYTDTQALDVHKRNPGLMIAVSISSLGQLQGLVRRGLAADHVIAWTGTERPDPGLWKQLAAEGVESSFGTTGRKGERFDDAYWKDGRGDEYEGLADSGLALVSTDLSDKVARALKADDRARTACGF